MAYIADKMLRAYKEDIKTQVYNRLHKSISCTVSIISALPMDSIHWIVLISAKQDANRESCTLSIKRNYEVQGSAKLARESLLCLSPQLQSSL